MTATAPRSASRIAIAVAIPLLLLISLVAWAFSSSVASSPDDDFHLPSIWCGLGERAGLCEDSGDPATRLVPAAIERPCYVFYPEISAECLNPSREGMVEVKRVNLGLYPPMFYAAMSLFATEDLQTSVIIMRIANATLAVGLITLTFWMLPRRLRTSLVVAALGAAVPLGLFIIPSTNPSSWAYVSAVLVWVGLYGATQTEGRRRIALSVLAVVGGVLGAGARADAAAYAVLAIVAAVVMGVTRRNRRGLLYPALAAVVIILSAAVFYLVASQSNNLVDGFGGEAAGQAPPLTRAQHLQNFLNIPSLWTGALGGWGLGWLDTAMPAVVWVFSVAVACGAIFIGLYKVSTKRWIAIGLIGGALWLAPFVVQARTNALVGQYVQPRYVLPLIVILLAVVSAAHFAERSWRGPRVIVAAAALSVAAAVALHTNIRRYTTGLDEFAADPGRDAEWWWTNVPSPLIVWLIGSLAFAAALALLAIGVTRTWREKDLVASETDDPLSDGVRVREGQHVSEVQGETSTA